MEDLLLTREVSGNCFLCALVLSRLCHLGMWSVAHGLSVARLPDTALLPEEQASSAVRAGRSKAGSHLPNPPVLPLWLREGSTAA